MQQLESIKTNFVVSNKMSVITVNKFKIASNAARKAYNSVRIHDRESLVISSAIGECEENTIYIKDETNV